MQDRQPPLIPIILPDRESQSNCLLPKCTQKSRKRESEAGFFSMMDADFQTSPPVPPLGPSHPAVHRLLSKLLPFKFFGANPAPLTRVETGFSGATIYRGEFPCGAVAVRGWPVGSVTGRRLAALHRMLAFAHQQGIVQLPVPMRLGQSVTWAFEEGRYWQCEPWMPGRADFLTRPTNTRLEAAMRLLARLHAALATYGALPAKDEFQGRRRGVSPSVLRRCDRIHTWQRTGVLWARNRIAEPKFAALRPILEPILRKAAAVAPSVAQRLQRFDSVEVPLQPCLRDVWHDHLLFTDDEVTGLIDPSAAGVESIAADLSRLLGSLLADDEPAWAFALEAYHREKRLSEAERELVVALDQSNLLLSPLTWVERLLKGAATLTPTLVDRLNRFDRRLETLRNRLVG